MADKFASNVLRALGEIVAPREERSQIFPTGSTSAISKKQGFNNPMTGPGDLFFGGDYGQWRRRVIGDENDILTVEGGVPVWKAGAPDLCDDLLAEGAWTDMNEIVSPSVIGPGVLEVGGDGRVRYAGVSTIDPSQDWTINYSFTSPAITPSHELYFRWRDGSGNIYEFQLWFNSGGTGDTGWLYSPDGWDDFVNNGAFDEGTPIDVSMSWDAASTTVSVTATQGARIETWSIVDPVIPTTFSVLEVFTSDNAAHPNTVFHAFEICQ